MDYGHLSNEEAWRLGQKFYRQKNYEEALKAFNAALAYNKGDCIAILDNRAATYVKLGNLKSALRDGQEMIHSQKKNVIGYLRTGKVLLSMGKNDIAQGIYQRGLKNVPLEDQNYKLLKAMHDKLIKDTAPPKAIDPLIILPMEIVLMVLEYLQFAEKVKSQGTVSGAVLFRLGRNEKESLNLLVRRCHGLKSLEIRSGFLSDTITSAAPSAKSLTSLVISNVSTVTLDAVTRILSSCTELEVARFGSIQVSGTSAQWPQTLPRLRVLSLHATTTRASFATLNLGPLIHSITNIQELSLAKWRIQDDTILTSCYFDSLKNLRTLILSIDRIERLPPLPPSLQHLKVFSSGLVRDLRTVDDIPWWKQLVNLETVALCGFSITIATLLELLAPSRGKFRRLSFRDLVALDGNFVSDLGLSEIWENVEELDLSGTIVTDRSISDLASFLSNHLRTIDLSHTRITGVAIKTLLDKFEGKLERLCVNGCMALSVDAVEYAKSKGVAVEFQFPDNLKNGKRIRLG
ncbi:MAG: hypothetical protein M1834_002510 [Cirrosporium novae-zelandiae]|nr:MAG: hypothetical protein M1834_002510 [Cirrosporium novae-zelandiae]